MSIAYWGPEIKVGVPQKALNINMDARTRISRASRCSFTLAEARCCRSSTSRTSRRSPDSDPDPEHHAAQSAARPDPADPANVEPINETAKLLADPRGAHRPGEGGALGRRRHRTGTLDVLRYGARAEGAPARRRARRRRSPSTASTTSRASRSKIKRGEFKQRLHAHPQRPDLHAARRCRHESDDRRSSSANIAARS